ncbi:hypothetical protein MSKU9_3181 [Komagataeibacter diospyri]|uniref:Transposase for insertion sequence element IS21-like C-terminal domain-containing protein n=1 Tax=Komagataeibacter diospyri TaxID=1932662 RepID=A0A4P5NTF1_9PROT|nr:hypothetical protein MSKU9_3181 [Komagataeibacter diospyri]
MGEGADREDRAGCTAPYLAGSACLCGSGDAECLAGSPLPGLPGTAAAYRTGPDHRRCPCNRYSVPASFANRPVSLRVYPDRLRIIAEGQVLCVHDRIITCSHVIERIFRHQAANHDNEYMMIDSTIIRARQHSAGTRKKGAQIRPSNGPAADCPEDPAIRITIQCHPSVERSPEPRPDGRDNARSSRQRAAP